MDKNTAYLAFLHHSAVAAASYNRVVTNISVGGGLIAFCVVNFDLITAATNVVGGFVGGDLFVSLVVAAIVKTGDFVVVIGDLGGFVVAVINDGVIGELVRRMGMVV